MTNKELQSRAIDVLRFPLAVMVVAIHTYFCEALKAPGNVDVPFSGEWAHELITFFSIVLTDAAVPTFFVISGFLCFYKAVPETKHWFSWGGYLQKTRRKTVSLLVPYIMWNLVAITIEPNYWDKPIDELLIGMWGFDGQGPWNGPLWFLRDLYVMMVLAPVFEYIVRKTRFALPVFFLCLIVGNFAGDRIVRGLSYVGIAYFSLGAYFGIFHKEVIAFLRQKKSAILTLYFLLMLGRIATMHMGGSIEVLTTNIGTIEAQLYIWSCIPACVIMASYIGERTRHMGVWKWLAGSSFTVYVMHRLINSKISAVGLMILNKPAISGWEAVTLYCLTITLTVSMCICAFWLLQKNNITNILFLGKRKR